ncbi:hypothetical protein Tco_0534812 [Tanacetum coccineum]
MPITERKLNAVKEDLVLNKKVLEATEAYTKNFTNLTELLTLVKTFDFLGLKYTIDSLKAVVDAQNDHLAKWVESSALLAWSVGARMIIIENTQANIQYEIASLKIDTFEIKAMITKIFYAFKGQSFSTPSNNVPKTTLAITKGLATVGGEGEKDDMVTKEAVEKEHVKEPETEHVEKEPVPGPELEMIVSSSRLQLTNTILKIPIHQPESAQATPKPDKGKGIARDTDESPRKLVPVSKEVCQDPDALEQATKARVDPKTLASKKGGHEFMKIQDDEIKTTSSRLKPETITDIKIYLNTKPIAITVYKGTDKRNFDVHKPSKFGDFGITELDELREIIPLKKNKVVEDLMNSLSKKYERLRATPDDLRIRSYLPDPGHVLSLTSGRKGRSKN